MRPDSCLLFLLCQCLSCESRDISSWSAVWISVERLLLLREGSGCCSASVRGKGLWVWLLVLLGVTWLHGAVPNQLWIFGAHLLPYSSLVKSVPTAPGFCSHLLQAFSFSLPPAVGGRRGRFAVSGNPKPGVCNCC